MSARRLGAAMILVSLGGCGVAAVEMFAQLVAALGRPALAGLQRLDQVLGRSQQAAEAARPYAQRMSAMISNLAGGISGSSAPLLLGGTGKDDRHLVVVATADRGLAGAFNSAIVREAPRAYDVFMAEQRLVLPPDTSCQDQVSKVA